MRFLTKFVLVLVLPAFVPAEPYPPLATLTYKADGRTIVVPAGLTFKCTPVAVYDDDGPVWCAEGPKIRIKAYGEPTPGFDGHSTAAKLTVLYEGAERVFDGHMDCGC